MNVQFGALYNVVGSAGEIMDAVMSAGKQVQGATIQPFDEFYLAKVVTSNEDGSVFKEVVNRFSELTIDQHPMDKFANWKVKPV